MSTTTARGIGVRHAVDRALATHNLGPADATFQLASCRVELDHQRRVVGAEATVAIRRPAPVGSRSPQALRGLVNPDGAHPLMVRIGWPRPFFLDVVPVTWERWLRRVDGERCPAGVDPMAPRTGLSFAQAQDFAARVQKRLPRAAELVAAWGPERHPWGPLPDPALGRVGAPRYGELPEVGLHPPSPAGLFDLGGWLWQWTAEGQLVGGATPEGGPVAVDPAAVTGPVGLRLATDG